MFWQAVKKGMDEACAQIEADCQMVFLQQDGNFQEQLNNLEAAIAQQPDGIIMTFAGGEIFDEAIDRAIEAGHPGAGVATSTTRRRPTACRSPARTSSRRATTSPPAWRRNSRRRARSTC